MYLIDTHVVSELRKRQRADAGVRDLFKQAEATGAALYLSAITVGELRRGADLIRHRGDTRQANQFDSWLSALLAEYA